MNAASLDSVVFVLYVQTFLFMNIFGWGVWHDQRFLFFSLIATFFYLSTPFVPRRFIRNHEASVRMGIVLAFLFVSVFISVGSFMRLRFLTAPEGFLSDSGVAVEVAGRALIEGKNPYAEEYTGTELARVPFVDHEGNTDNPALYYMTYPPLLIVLSAVSQIAVRSVIPYYDIRMVYLVFYVLFLLSGAFIVGKNKTHFLYVLVFAGMNPMFLTSLGQGANDVVVMAFIMWSIALLYRRRPVSSGILLGLAAGTKQTAWAVLPLCCVAGYAVLGKRDLVRYMIACFVSLGIIVVPFILADPAAFADSTVRFLSGSLEKSYPIQNFGLGMLLVTRGVIPSIYAYYPFWIWQLTALAPLLYAWQIMFLRRPAMSSLLLGISAVLSVVWFFNRFMNFSYLGVLQVFVALSYVVFVSESGKTPHNSNQPNMLL